MTLTVPRQIENAATGDRITFIQSPLLGDGAVLVFRGILPPHAVGAPLHTHDKMTETFMVESGALEITLGDDQTQILNAGDMLTVEPGTRHGFRNPLDAETRFVTTADPGADLEAFLRMVYQMGSDSVGGTRNLPHSALVFGSVMARTDMVIAGLPRWFQRACWGLAAVIANLIGLHTDTTPPRMRELAR